MSWQVYGAYARACGVPAVLTFLVTVALSEGSRNFSDAWLARWSGSDGKISSEQGIELYALVALICLVTGVVYSTTRVLVGQRGCLGEIRAKSLEIPVIWEKDRGISRRFESISVETRGPGCCTRSA